LAWTSLKLESDNNDSVNAVFIDLTSFELTSSFDWLLSLLSTSGDNESNQSNELVSSNDVKSMNTALTESLLSLFQIDNYVPRRVVYYEHFVDGHLADVNLG
jgi:hypothetical protein